MKPPEPSPAAQETPWYAEKSRRKTARELLKDELKTIRGLSPRIAVERHLASLRWQSALRVRQLLKEKNFDDDAEAVEPLDLAAGSHSVLLIAKAAGAVKKGVNSLLAGSRGKEFARGYLLSQAMLPLRHVPGPHPLLEAILRERAEAVDLEDNALDELFSFHEQIAVHDEKNASSAYFLHLMLHDVQSTREVVAAHAVPSSPTMRSFFVEAVEAAAYFEQVLLARAQGDPAREAQAVQTLNMLLMEIMNADALKGRHPDLYQIAGAWYGRQHVANRFLLRPTADGPYDDKKLGELLPLRVPAPLLANVLARVDLAEELCAVRHAAEKLFAAAERALPEADVVWTANGVPSALSVFSGILHRPMMPPVAECCGKLRTAFPPASALPPAGALEVLREWLARHRGIDVMRSVDVLPGADPSTEIGLLLGTLCPRRIVNDPSAQRLFLDALACLHELPPSSSRAVAAQIRRALIDPDPHHPDVFMLLPLEPCHGHPEAQGRAIRELLQEYVGTAYPAEWTRIVPTQTADGLGMRVGDASKDFSCAVEPFSDRPDLDRASQAFKAEFKSERYVRASRLLLPEIKHYVAAGDAHWVLPNLGGAQAFGYVFDGLFPKVGRSGKDKPADGPKLRSGDEILIGSQEYYQMFRERIEKSEGRVKAAYFPRRHADGSPFTPETLSDELDRRISAKTKMMLLSVESRFGDVLFGSHPRPYEELERFMMLLRMKHSNLVVVLDACQALARVTMPRMEALDDHTILLGTGAKMPGVRDVGFAVVPAGLARTIQRRHYGDEYDEAKHGCDPCGTTLSSRRMFEMYVRLRELSGVYGRHDALKPDHDASFVMPAGSPALRAAGSEPLPTGERVMQRLRGLTAAALRCAEAYGAQMARMLEDVPAYRAAGAEQARAASCRVFAPTKHHPASYGGIVTLSFPAVPPAIVKDRLAARGYQSSDICLDGTAIRFAFNEFQEDEHVEALFLVIAEIHRDYIQGQAAIRFEERCPEDVEMQRSGLPVL